MIEKVIGKLVNSTNDNAVEWRRKPSSTNKRYNFELISNDPETKFDFDIDLDDELKPKDGYLWIYHKDIIDGRKLIPEYKYSGITSLRDILYDKYIKDEIKVFLNEDVVFESILDKIGDKQYNRDSKIEKILNEPAIEIEEDRVAKKKNWFGF